MISRRILRLKVMQLLFSNAVGNSYTVEQMQKQILQKVEKTKQLYFVYLQYLIELCKYAITDAYKEQEKLLNAKKKNSINIDLASNKVIKTLIESKEFKKTQEHYKLKSFVDKAIVSKEFAALKKSKKYLSYCLIKDKSKNDDIEICRYILKKIIGADHLLDENLSEHFTHIEDDHFITLHSLQKKIKNYENENDETFIQSILLKEQSEESLVFAEDLIAKYIAHEAELNKSIQAKTKNWEIDRIATIDVILMKLALSEFLYFPYIPLKVSLNEYIDIAKEYSTEKSKDFINGILDKLMKDLKSQGKIKKLGRGLLNN